MRTDVHYAYTIDGLVFFKAGAILFGTQVEHSNYWTIEYYVDAKGADTGILKMVDNPIWGVTIGKLATVTNLDRITSYYYNYDSSLHTHARRVELIKVLLSGRYDDMRVYHTGMFPVMFNQTLEIVDIKTYRSESGMFYFEYLNPRTLNVTSEMLNLCEEKLKIEQAACDMYRRYRDAAERLREDRLMIIDNILRWKEDM